MERGTASSACASLEDYDTRPRPTQEVVGGRLRIREHCPQLIQSGLDNPPVPQGIEHRTSHGALPAQAARRFALGAELVHDGLPGAYDQRRSVGGEVGFAQPESEQRFVGGFVTCKRRTKSDAGGVIVSETLHYAAPKQAEKAYASGYDKGKSDAVKQQYWMYVSMQKQHNGAGNVRLCPIELPEQRVDGVTFLPSTKMIRIEE